MSNSAERPDPRLPRGFVDRRGTELHGMRDMIDRLRVVYERYGFELLETPCVEYVDALGKFLPDQDRPNEGVFAFRDDDEKWLCLRYDLTAPLARFYAENAANLPKPFRRYQIGQVFRNEKPGPGRFREFTQFDADAVGAVSMAADAEFCMLVSDAMEAVGLKRGEYVVKINNRKILNGILEVIGVPPGSEGDEQRGTVLRAMDKLDRLKADGVRLLLGKGRKDESGDVTQGAGLGDAAIDRVIAFLGAGGAARGEVCDKLQQLVGDSTVGLEGVDELRQMDVVLTAAAFGEERVRVDPSVVRGLAYYTGPVFEVDLTFPVKDEDGKIVPYGSVAGGGRYDGLVERFTGEKVPATGISIGVSRLAGALAVKGLFDRARKSGPVLVLVLDKGNLGGYQRMVSELHDAGVAAELYHGDGGMKQQLRYADRRGASIAIIEGGDERGKGEIQLKDLVLGAELAKTIESRADWAKDKPAQQAAPRADLVKTVQAILARH